MNTLSTILIVLVVAGILTAAGWFTYKYYDKKSSGGLHSTTAGGMMSPAGYGLGPAVQQNAPQSGAAAANAIFGQQVDPADPCDTPPMGTGLYHSNGNMSGDAYTEGEDPYSLYPSNGCGPDKHASNYYVDPDELLPASWRAGATPDAKGSGMWSAFDEAAPKPEHFQDYIVSNGTAQLGINTRSPHGRQLGTVSLLRGQPPVALSLNGCGEAEFNDSSFRLDLMRKIGITPGR